MFGKVIDLWSGIEEHEEMDFGDVYQLARIADQFQITEVAAVLEEALMEHLGIENCGEMLSLSSTIGLSRLEVASQICERSLPM